MTAEPRTAIGMYVAVRMDAAAVAKCSPAQIQAIMSGVAAVLAAAQPSRLSADADGR